MQSSGDINILTSAPFSQKLFIIAKTTGSVISKSPFLIDVEVCGNERV
jgi:hypothetical protein